MYGMKRTNTVALNELMEETKHKPGKMHQCIEHNTLKENVLVKITNI
jgi:hypothetical protein